MRPASDLPRRVLDDLIFGAANAWAWLRHPLLVRASLRRLGRVPDFARPRGHDALMQWRKLFDHNPLFVTFCDKLAARDWVAARHAGVEFAELLWTGSSVDALPMHLLDGDVVLKTSSGTGSNYFPTRRRWDEATLRSRFTRWLRRPRHGMAEWAYGRLPARLYVERLNGSPDEIVDLTFRCQNGRIASAFAGFAWKTDHSRELYFSASGIPLFEPDPALARDLAEKLPAELFDRAASIAATLSQGIDHVRVDLQLRGERIFFGELTVYSSSGFGEEERVGVGTMIERQWVAELERSWFLSTPQSWPLSLYQAAFRRWLQRRQLELAIAQQGEDDEPQYRDGRAQRDAEAYPAVADHALEHDHEGRHQVAIGDDLGGRQVH